MASEFVKDGQCLRLRNEHVELVMDPRDGQVREIWNRRLNWNFKTTPDGAWPISYWIRHPIYPWWGGRPRQLATSAEEYMATPSVRASRSRDGVGLRLDYPEIGVVRRHEMQVYPGVLEGTASPEVMADREPAGISASVEISLPHDADYLLFRAKLDLRKSRCDVVRFGSGWGGGLRADGDPECEHVAAPEWYGGAIYDNPRQAIARKELVGKNMIWPYIGGSPNSLLAGWIDYYGRRGGLGIGYLGKSGQIVAFEAGADADSDGLSLNWRTFDLSGVNTYFGDHAIGFDGLYPLEAGKTYTSDWWIVAPHEGDWHRMADIYREQYHKTFEGEHLAWQSISETAREADYVLPANFSHAAGGRHFGTFPAAVKATVGALDVEPRRCIVWVIGTQKEGFDTTFPDFFPMHKICGGDDAARQAIAELRAMGIGGSFIYTNPSYDHPLADLFVAQADTGIRANHGDFACFASPAWQRTWLEKLAPALLKAGACGIQLDQWPLLFCPCRRKGHGHKTDSMAALRGQNTGKRAWAKALRDALTAGEPRWFFFSEAGTDLVGGLVDIWTFGLNAFYPGGKPATEIARFTHPQYVMTSGLPILDGLINGFLAVMVGVGKDAADTASAQAMAARSDFQEYRRIRAELRAADPPGYPYGFRDTLGLAAQSPDVPARAYRDDRGITVLYYARNDVETRIDVLPEALGHAGKPPETIAVSLKAGQAAWWSKRYSG
jgi:hypothetical protein